MGSINNFQIQLLCSHHNTWANRNTHMEISADGCNKGDHQDHNLVGFRLVFPDLQALHQLVKVPRQPGISQQPFHLQFLKHPPRGIHGKTWTKLDKAPKNAFPVTLPGKDWSRSTKLREPFCYKTCYLTNKCSTDLGMALVWITSLDISVKPVWGRNLGNFHPYPKPLRKILRSPCSNISIISWLQMVLEL